MLGDVQRGGNVTKEGPFSATFKLNKETKNTICYALDAEHHERNISNARLGTVRRAQDACFDRRRRN